MHKITTLLITIFFIFVLSACNQSTITTPESRVATPTSEQSYQPKTPILFQGVYDGSQGDYQFLPQASEDVESGWGITDFANNFLFNENKKYAQSMNIVDHRKFTKISLNKLDDSLRMGFVRIYAHHYEKKFSTGKKQLWTTMKLSWIEVGSATDRQSLHRKKTLEVLNTQTIIIRDLVNDINPYNREKKLKARYKEQLNKGLEELFEQVLSNNFQTHEEAVYFMVDSFKIGGNAKKWVNKYLQTVNKTKNANEQQEFMQNMEVTLRNRLNYHINSYRKHNSDFSRIILLPSKNEMQNLTGLWASYARRYQQKEDKGQDSRRSKIKPVHKLVRPACKLKTVKNEKIIDVAGYWIQAILAKFERKKTKQDEHDIFYQARSVVVGQLGLPITQKITNPAPVYNPKKDREQQQIEQREVGLSYQGFVTSKSKGFRSEMKLNYFEQALTDSIDELAMKLATVIKQTVNKNHIQSDLNFKDFCAY